MKTSELSLVNYEKKKNSRHLTFKSRDKLITAAHRRPLFTIQTTKRRIEFVPLGEEERTFLPACEPGRS